MYGIVYYLWLIGNLVDFQAERQVFLDFPHHGAERFSERQDVASIFHGNGNANGRFAIEEHLGFCRLHETAFHFGNIPQPENASIRRNGHVPDGIHIVEDARHAQADIVGRCLHASRRGHPVLGMQGIADGLRRNAELRQPRILHFHIDLFFLFPDELGFLHIRHTEQEPARLFRRSPHFLIGKAVPRDGINGTEDIIEPVIVIGAIDSLRQVLFDVLAEIAHIAPCGPDLLLVYGIRKIHKNHGCPCAGLALDVVQPRRILELLFQLVRDLFFHLLCGCPGP